MILSPAWAGRRYAVLGLARSGRATVDALLVAGAEVVAWDADPDARAMCSGEGRSTPELVDPLTLDLTGFAAVVVSPGIPLNRHPIAAHAAAAGVLVIGDIELFAEARAHLPPHKVVGITGTNGKSTTTALVHHILETAGVPSLMGGNIGLPILAQEPLPEGGVYVLELSSYQIDLTRTLDCDVAVLLNVTPDHLDRYDGFKGYLASKVRLFAMQQNGQAAVLTDGEGTNPVLDWLTKRRPSADILYCTTGYEDVWAASVVLGEASWQFEAFDSQENWPALRGPANAQNAASAVTVAMTLGVPLDMIVTGLRSFGGLGHRMERVGDVHGVAYVNDSKATNPEAAAPALASFPSIRWIVGGRAKTAELTACAPYFGNVRAAYTIGEAGPMFAALLAPHMHVEECDALDVALFRAALQAEPGDTVLLSPAAASFDQFTDFEARGRAFAELVEQLP